MAKAQIALKLQDKSLAQKQDLNRNVVVNMGDNAVLFTDPDPPLADLTAVDAAITAKLVEVEQANTVCATKQAELDTLEKQQDDLLTTEGKYVEKVCKGNVTDLTKSGMPLEGTGAPIGPLPKPTNLHTTGGDMEGEVDAMWNPVHGASSYIGECATVATGPCKQFYVGKKSKGTCGDNPPGSLVYLRVCAVGPLGRGPWSDIAQQRAS